MAKKNRWIYLSDETLRKWTIEVCHMEAKKQKERKIYKRRKRRSHFGELLQEDGTKHAWFKDRGDHQNFFQRN
jgi:c-di-GMP-related signal transduction protein